MGARLPLGPPDDPRLAPRRGARRARRLHASFTAALADASVPSAGLGAAPCDSLVSALAGVLSEVREAAQKQQRELSRGIEPIVQGRMLPGYDTATAEAGTGSHRRRVAILEQHVRAEAPKMFRAAADGAPPDCRRRTPPPLPSPPSWESCVSP